MKSSAPKAIEPKYGRLLDDFPIGVVYHHPWEVTLGGGTPFEPLQYRQL